MCIPMGFVISRLLTHNDTVSCMNWNLGSGRRGSHTLLWHALLSSSHISSAAVQTSAVKSRSSSTLQAPPKPNRHHGYESSKAIY